MPNPEQLVVAAELLQAAGSSAARTLPGLIELAGPAAKVAGQAGVVEGVVAQGAKAGLIGLPKTVSLLEAPNAALIKRAAEHLGDPVPAVILSAAEESGLPLGVRVGSLRQLSAALENGNPQAVTTTLYNTFRPRTYAEMSRFWGG